MIRKSGKKYVLMTSSGSRKLGTHSSRAWAVAGVREVETATEPGGN